MRVWQTVGVAALLCVAQSGGAFADMPCPSDSDRENYARLRATVGEVDTTLRAAVRQHCLAADTYADWARLRDQLSLDLSCRDFDRFDAMVTRLGNWSDQLLDAANRACPNN